ncbi:hypothetical protein BV25DRAFT_1919567 [Artomyces pyxidatus]|uniref:Uncharacterized protein n=1 Tax=Artomyces pyxidatus TaxID=48021 RepID=A0ACB8SPR9_9AGAM|nr:hypothetical protein BV25DRAFT_1919567 [Artomyces pyxidatus]
MQSFLLSFVTAAVAVASVSAQSFTINTPASAAECLPLAISWSGGSPPYTLVSFSVNDDRPSADGSVFFSSVASGTDPNGPALAILSSDNSGTSFSWPQVNFPAGTSLDLNVRDSTGILAQTAPFTVNPGTTGCLNGGSSSSSGSASSAPTSGSTSSTGASAAPTTSSTTSAAAPTSTAPTSSHPSSASSASSAPSKASTTSAPTTANAAPRATAFGAAGLLGAVVAAVLA